MKIGYTEFSFGYAFTENLIRSSTTAPKGAPVFPNLIQEGKGGFDVHINLPGLPLFFQYKLPESMKRNTAFEISQHAIPGFTVPFFRMGLMRRDISDQHDLLIDLEKKYPNTVLYASPVLHDLAAFNRAYSAANVHRRSVFFSPTDIGPLPDNLAHSIAYQDNFVGYFFSEPRKIAARNYETLEQDIRARFEEKSSHSLQNVSVELRNSVRPLVSNSMRQSEAMIEERIRTRRSVQLDTADKEKERVITDILVTREMTRVDLGVDLMIAQPRI
jgi:hypothetical protein